LINENLKFYIKIRSKQESINDIFKELKSAIPDCDISLSLVTRWFNRFKSIKNNLKDGHRSRRPITDFTKPNIDRVRGVIENN
jgi:hypothetical protein